MAVKPDELGEHQGRKVTRVKIKVTNAGDGLSKAVSIEPQLLTWGKKVYVVLETDPGADLYKPIKDSDSECEMIVSLVAGTGTIVDVGIVKKAIEEQTEKNLAEDERRRLEEEKSKGIQRLPTDEKLIEDHDEGLHTVPYIGCPECFPDAVKTDAKASGSLKKPKAPAAKKSPAKPRKSTAKKS